MPGKYSTLRGHLRPGETIRHGDLSVTFEGTTFTIRQGRSCTIFLGRPRETLYFHCVAKDGREPQVVGTRHAVSPPSGIEPNVQVARDLNLIAAECEDCLSLPTPAKEPAP